MLPTPPREHLCKHYLPTNSFVGWMWKKYPFHRSMGMMFPLMPLDLLLRKHIHTHARTTPIPVADFAFVAIDNILCESLLIAPMLVFKMAKIFWWARNYFFLFGIICDVDIKNSSSFLVKHVSHMTPISGLITWCSCFHRQCSFRKLGHSFFVVLL